MCMCVQAKFISLFIIFLDCFGQKGRQIKQENGLTKQLRLILIWEMHGHTFINLN